MSHISFSFEVFPPKTPDAEEKMWAAIKELSSLNAKFISVTYGAGGTTRDYTHEIAKKIVLTHQSNTAAHLTCVGARKEEINAIARAHWDAGVNHIVALRGDPPKGTVNYTPHPDGYGYATDLVRGLKSIADFEISVAAFPEKHPESTSFDQDIEILKIKSDIGCTRAITQFFFDDDFYLRLRDRAVKAGVNMPVIPGIIPINNFTNVKRFSGGCGTSMPVVVEEKFTGLEPDSAAHNEAAIDFATQQCRHLIAEGVNFFHFYSMNRADLIKGVLANL